jgi:hypothetical protein
VNYHKLTHGNLETLTLLSKTDFCSLK